jgi:hypothetical protein
MGLDGISHYLDGLLLVDIPSTSSSSGWREFDLEFSRFFPWSFGCSVNSFHSPFLKIKARQHPHNKCDALHHRHTLIIVVKAPHTTWQYFGFAVLLSFLFPSTCREDTQEWVSRCFPCEHIIFLIRIKFTIIIVRRI